MIKEVLVATQERLDVVQMTCAEKRLGRIREICKVCTFT